MMSPIDIPLPSQPGIMAVRAVQGDTLDSLCHRHLLTSAPVESLHELNRGLAALGPILPAGQLVYLPNEVAAEPSGSTVVNLWD